MFLFVYKACKRIQIDAPVHLTYCSHSPTSGISIYVDGHHRCSQYKPTTTTTSNKPVTSPPTPNPLCMGSYGTPSGTHQNNVTLWNLGIAISAVQQLENLINPQQHIHRQPLSQRQRLS